MRMRRRSVLARLARKVLVGFLNDFLRTHHGVQFAGERESNKSDLLQSVSGRFDPTTPA